MAGAKEAADAVGLPSHSLGQEAYSDADNDADEEVSLASALLPCKVFTCDNNTCNDRERDARV